MNKNKIVSVLFYPYENCFVVQITRGKGAFSFPQRSRKYILDFADSNVLHKYEWALRLMNMHNASYFHSARSRWLSK